MTNEEIRQLKAENERLKADKDKYYQQTLDDEIQINELLQTLQEIKKYIAKICKEECGYVQKKRCPDCDCRYGVILDLITKAESEG